MRSTSKKNEITSLNHIQHTWLALAKKKFGKKNPVDSKSISLDEKIFANLKTQYVKDVYIDLIKAEYNMTKDAMIGFLESATIQLLKLANGETIDPVSIMTTYAESHLFGSNYRGKMYIPIEEIIKILKLTHEEIYSILIACIIHKDERVRATIALDCINLLAELRAPMLDEFLDKFHFHFFIHQYHNRYDYESRKRSAVNLEGIFTFIRLEHQSIPRAEAKKRNDLESFSKEFTKISSVKDFLYFLLTKLKSIPHESTISIAILGYVYDNPLIYKEIFSTSALEEKIFPSKKYYSETQIVFFNRDPKAKIKLVEQLKEALILKVDHKLQSEPRP